MAYIGKTPTSGDFVLLDSITTSATASYTMQKNSVNFSPQSANHMILSLNGTIQAPISSFTVSGSTLTFASALTSSDVIDFILVLGNVNDVGVASSVVDSAITKNKTDFITDGSSAGVTVKGSGSDSGSIALNCSSNSHFVSLISPDHSAGQSYKLKLPDNNVTADKFIKVKSITGSGATATGQLEFADAGGTLVEVGQGSISAGSNVASMNFSNIFSSTYNSYFVRLSKIRFVGVSNLRLRFFSDTSTTEISSSYYYYSQYGLDASGNEERTNANGQSYVQMSQDIDFDQPADGGITGFIYIDNPLANDSFSVTAYGQMCYRNDANVWNGINFAGKYSGSSARYGFKLYGSENIDYGDVTVYGIKP
jgi:hypothetical protein